MSPCDLGPMKELTVTKRRFGVLVDDDRLDMLVAPPQGGLSALSSYHVGRSVMSPAPSAQGVPFGRAGLRFLEPVTLGAEPVDSIEHSS
jgi:hypothetical protein